MATVTNFKAVKKEWDRDNREWSSDDYIYIGRYNPTYNLPQSAWANPFQMGAESQREKVIEQYRIYIKRLIAEGKVNLEELRGKTMVCWCSPKHCHGDVLLELLGELE